MGNYWTLGQAAGQLTMHRRKPDKRMIPECQEWSHDMDADGSARTVGGGGARKQTKD